MKKKVCVALSAIALSTAGVMFGAASPATAAGKPGGTPVFFSDGSYAGCVSNYTGVYFYPDEITYAGCISDWESGELEAA